jgi:integrase
VFRRGLGTNLAELGVDELTIQRILRHANVATTRQHYINVRNPKAEAPNAVAGCGIVR